MAIQMALIQDDHRIEMESDVRRTPEWIFDRLGLEFDMDVASPLDGVSHVPARRKLTIRDDGLTQPWNGLVWCNPPFSDVTPWAHRWCRHPDGVFLVATPASQWLAKVCKAAHLSFMFEKQVEFDGGKNRYPTMVFARGRRAVTALESMSDLGCLLKACQPGDGCR